MKEIKPEEYWERAGELSYATAMFAHPDVEKHINHRLWKVGIGIGKTLGLNEQSHVLDLGCGDGTLTNEVLSKHFRAVDGFDLSSAAIKRAQDLAPNSNLHFAVCDITKMDYSTLPNYDGAYLWGILHHVKSATLTLLKDMNRAAIKHVVVLEPNGNHIIRKLLEKTSTYKIAGEDSFRIKELEHIFHQAGYSVVIRKRLNLFPNFTPKPIFQLLKYFEPFIENTPILRAFCTINMWGFVAYGKTHE